MGYSSYLALPWSYYLHHHWNTRVNCRSDVGHVCRIGLCCRSHRVLHLACLPKAFIGYLACASCWSWKNKERRNETQSRFFSLQWAEGANRPPRKVRVWWDNVGEDQHRGRRGIKKDFPAETMCPLGLSKGWGASQAPKAREGISSKPLVQAQKGQEMAHCWCREGE